MRIHLLRTEGEWNYIKDWLQKNKHTDLHTYLHREISRLKNHYEECDVCVTPADGNMVKIRHNVPLEIYNSILPIAQKMGKPVSTIIDDLIIMRLLFEGKDAAV